MKTAYNIGMAVAVLLMLGSNAFADAYKVSGAGAAIVNGIYDYWGTHDTMKDDYPSGDDRGPVPVYRKTGTNYYLGYRGCSTKWVIIELPGGPAGSPDLDGGYISGWMYGNKNNTLTPPSTGWYAEKKHPDPDNNPTPDPPPIVTLYIPQTIALNKSNISSTTVQGSNASTQSFRVWNSGGGTLGYTISDNRSWLYCLPSSGTSTGEQDTISVYFNTSGLSAGTYSATITIQDADATNSPRYISVSLTVNPPPTIALTPGSLFNSNIQSSNAPSQSFKVWNSGGVTLSYTISDNKSWLYCLPSSGTSTGEQDTIGVYYTTSGLSAGTYNATITISASGATNTPRTIPVSLTVNPLPTIALTPGSLSNSNIQGSNAPSQSFKVWNSGGVTLSYTISDNKSWLYCLPSSGTSTGEQDTIGVYYTTSGLSAGTYNATITVSASGATNAPRTIPVSLTVTELPAILSSATSLSNSTVKGNNAPIQAFEVWNSAGNVLGYTISDNADWLSCSPASGTSSGEHDSIQVAYSTSGLSYGIYNATIMISAAGASNSPINIPVALNVTLPAAISVEPMALANTCLPGANAPVQAFEVWNSSGNVIDYTITDNVSWLSCLPGSGSSTGERDSIQVSYFTSDLPEGLHTATITIQSPGTNNDPISEEITVSLNVSQTVSIDTHPVSQSKYVEQNVIFTVGATGTPPISYQWKKDGALINGATSSSYTLYNLTADDAGGYSCAVQNNSGSAESSTGNLTVLSNDKPVITGQNPNPLDTTGGSAFTILLENLSVTDNNDAFPVDFTLNVMPGDGYTVAGHVVTPLESLENNALLVGVSVHDGEDESNVYMLSVAFNSVEPVITEIFDGPASVTNAETYALTIGGEGVAAYKYQIDDGAWSLPVDVDEPLEFTLEEGFHTLEVVGGDANGRWQSQNRATIIAWTIDTTPPAAVLSNFPVGTVGLTAVNATVGGLDVRYYRFSLDEGNWGSILPVNQSLVIAGLEDGVHTLEVIGMDTAGNWASVPNAEGSITWEVDTSVPTAVLFGLPDLVTSEMVATISVGHEEDTPSVDQYKYSLDNGMTWQHGDGPTISLDPQMLQEGVNRIMVNAYNQSLDLWQDGDVGESTTSATVFTWRIDQIPPAAPVLAPDYAFPATTAVSLIWSATEDDLQSYQLYAADHAFDAASMVAADTYYVGLYPGPEGRVAVHRAGGLSPGMTYYFGVVSEDQAGNLSALSNIAVYTTTDSLPQVMSASLAGGGSAGDNTMERTLIITGENFVPGDGNVVRFSCPPRTFEIQGVSENGSTMTAVVPCGAPVGIYSLKVANANGTSRDCTSTYTVLPAAAQLPEVIHVQPSTVTGDADASIVITGNNFIVRDIKAESVTLVGTGGGMLFLTMFTVEHSQKISTIVPSGVLTKGSYDIRVTTANGSNDVSTAKLEVVDPVDLSVAGIVSQSTTQGFDMSQIGAGETTEGILPVAVTLKTPSCDNNHTLIPGVLKIEVEFAPGTRIYYDDGASPPRSYDGVINPPRQIPITSDLAEKISRPSHAAVFQMGSIYPLKLGDEQIIFARIDMVLPDTAEPPLVYLVTSGGDIKLAGVDGEWQGTAISRGGTVLTERRGQPETGYTTYTIGLLLDHMSTFVVGTAADGDYQATTTTFSVGDDEGSTLGCFIDAAREK